MKHLGLILVLLALVLQTKISTVSGQCLAVGGTPDSPSLTCSHSSSIDIPVVFHVVHKDDNTGFVSIAEIEDQMDALNNGFSTTLYDFYLAGIHYIEDNNLFNGKLPDFGDENHAITAFNIDQTHVMNVFVGDMASNLFGWGNRPHIEDAPIGEGYDYIMLDWVTLPDGDPPPTGIHFDDGDNLVHEAGHYLGLEHVFRFTLLCPYVAVKRASAQTR